MVQRYNIGIGRSDNDLFKLMETFYTEEADDEGLYVKYEDHTKEIAALERERDELKLYIIKADKMLAQAKIIMDRFSRDNAKLKEKIAAMRGVDERSDI